MFNKRFLVLVSLVSTCAWASAVDVDLHDFMLNAMTEDKGTLEQDRTDLNKQITEMNKRVPRSDYADLQKQVDKYQAETLLLNRITSEVPAKIDDKALDAVKFSAADVAALDKPASGRDATTINNKRGALDDEQKTKQAELDALKTTKKMTAANIARKDELEARLAAIKTEETKLKDELSSRGPVTKTVALGKEQRLLLVATMQKTADGKVEMSFTTRWNPAKKSDLPSEVKDRFTDQELNDYIQSQVGDHFGDKITLDSPVNDAAVAKALKAAKESSYLRNVVKDFGDDLGDRKAKLGKDNDDTTLLGEATKKLNDKKGTGNADKKLELQAKVTLATWLKSHSAANMDVCDVYKQALGDWTKFPKQAKEDCPKLDPAAAAADKAKADALASQQNDAQNAQQLALQQQWAAATAQCNRKAADDAVQALTADITKSLTNFKNYVEQKVLPKSKLFLALLAKGDDSDNPVNQGMPQPVSQDDIASVIGTVGKGVDGTKDLAAEKSALDDMMTKAFQNLKASESVQGSALAQMEAAMAAGKPLPLDPTSLQSSNQGVIQMRDWYNKIVALRAGVVAELNGRVEQNENRFGPGASANGGQSGTTGVSNRAVVNQNGSNRRQPINNNNNNSNKKNGSSAKPRYLQ